jgi:hypothetical protein
MTTDATPTAEETITEVWTYRGRRRWYRKGKDPYTVYVWDHGTDEEYGYKKQPAPGAFIGARYRVTVTADHQSYYTGGEHRPVLLTDAGQADPGQVAEWQAADKAAGIDADLAALERRHGGQIEGLHEALLPIKLLLYDGQAHDRSGQPNRRRKALIIAAVLSELDRW